LQYLIFSFSFQKESRIAYGSGILLPRNAKLLAVGKLSGAESAQEVGDTSDETTASSLLTEKV
jgi:hypothetical protein